MLFVVKSFSLSIREENFLYMDRTSYIRTLEEMGDSLLFIRPRRFGKSLWLKNTLRCYYDVALANRFDALFSDLAIGRNPTRLHNKYFVLEDEKTYKSLVHKDGPLKTLFKAVKEFMKTRRIDRLFLTGVSPCSDERYYQRT